MDNLIPFDNVLSTSKKDSDSPPEVEVFANINRNLHVISEESLEALKEVNRLIEGFLFGFIYVQKTDTIGMKFKKALEEFKDEE